MTLLQMPHLSIFFDPPHTSDLRAPFDIIVSRKPHIATVSGFFAISGGTFRCLTRYIRFVVTIYELGKIVIICFVLPL